MRSWFLFLILSFLAAGCSTSAGQRAVFPSSELAPLGASLPAEEGARLEELPLPELLRQGKELLARGNLSLARLHFLMALRKDSASVAAFTGFGDVEAKAGDLEKAQIAYGMALQRQADHLPALLALARLQAAVGKTEEALALLLQARQINPENLEIVSQQAILLDRMERYAEAELLHLQAAGHRPDTASSLNNLGFHYLLRQSYEKAIPPLQKAVRLDPRNEVTRNNLAVAYLLTGAAEKALLLFRESVGEAAAWNNLGYLYMTQGNRTLAEKAFRKALDLDPRLYVTARDNLDKLQRLMAQTDEPLLPGRDR